MSSASVRAVPSLTHYASLVSDDEDWTPADEARLARSYASPSPSFASIVVGSPNVLGAGVGSYGASSRAMAAATAVPVVPRTMSISVASYAHANGNGNGIGGGSAIVHPLRDTDIDAASVAAALPSAPTAAPSAPLPSMRRALWTLLLCTATYLVNMAQRYSIGVVAKPLERRLHFGDGEGSGMAYQLLAGPVFNLLFTSMGVMLAAGARDWSRTRLLTAALLIGCAASAGMGASQSYAELAVSRAAQGLSQAGVSSFCASLLSAAFPPRLRGRALSIFNFGVYAGYGAAFGAGNWLAHVEGPPDQHPDGYRLMFYVFAGPSLLCAVLMALTVQDPVWEGKRKARAERARVEQGRIANGADDLPQRITLAEPLLLAQEDSSSSSNGGGAPAPAPATGATGGAAAAAPPAVPSLRAVFWMLVSSPPLIVLCLASSLRNGAGVTWGYNTQQWFESSAGGSLSPAHIGAWMSWIPVVFGSAGAVLGGIASDFLLTRGPAYQVALLVLTQLAAAPCAAGVLLLRPPYSFLMLFPTYLIGESYIGTCMAMLMDRTPAHAHSLVLSLYIFGIANLGGNASLLLPPLQRALGGNMRDALLILWPGFIVASGLVYALLWFCTRKDGG